MGVRVNVPAPLRQYCDRKKEIEVEGGSIASLLSNVSSEYSLLYSKICDESGVLRQYVNLYVNGVDIKKLSELETKIKEGDVINIIPAVAGGIGQAL